MARLFLVRHGESTWNAERRWQGRSDPPLTERGEDQARQAIRAAATVAGFELVVTSTLRRARRTGELLAAGLGIDLAPPVAALAERAAGPWEGLTRVEIEQRYPGYLAAERRPEGYEDDASIITRAGAAIEELVAAHDGRAVLVVSHGGVINALERNVGEAWLRLDNLEGRWFQPVGERITPVGARVHLLADGDADGPGDSAYA